MNSRDDWRLPGRRKHAEALKVAFTPRERTHWLCRLIGHNWHCYDANWTGRDYFRCWRWGCGATTSTATGTRP